MRMKLGILMLLFLLPTIVSAQRAAPNIDRLRQELDSFFAGRSAEDPGGVIIVENNGRPVYRKAFGKSNLETGSDIGFQTVFEAASVSKQFTAGAVLKLVEEGKVKLSDDVRTFVPELPDYGATITVEHLLTHTGGLKDWRNITYLQSHSTATKLFTQDIALDFICRQKSLNFLPGEQYRYSNSGYDLLGTLVERVSGQSFASYVKEKLLDPAGMNHSQVRHHYTDIIKNRAFGYLTTGNTYRQGLVLDETYGAAGLYATAEDLIQWQQYIFSDRVPPSFRQMRVKQFVLNDGTTIPYAHGGVEVHPYKGQSEIRHGGLISGYRAWLVYFPEARISVAYMSNDRNIMTVELSRVIREALFGTVDVAAHVGVGDSLLRNLEGIYYNTGDAASFLELILKDGELTSLEHKASFKSLQQFSINGDAYSIVGEDLIHATPFGRSRYKKAEKAQPTDEELVALCGSYYSEEAAVLLNLKIEDGKLYASRASYDRFQLVPLYRTRETVVFKGQSNGLRVLFHFNSTEEQKTGFWVSLPRADKIHFSKINKN